MHKKTSSGGLFFDPNYEYRHVYTLEDLMKLTKEGFLLTEYAGLLALNILLKAED